MSRIHGCPSPDVDRGVYGITLAAELVGMGTQNLRMYKSQGWVLLTVAV